MQSVDYQCSWTTTARGYCQRLIQPSKNVMVLIQYGIKFYYYVKSCQSGTYKMPSHPALTTCDIPLLPLFVHLM
jgi:hypothetical protein